MYILFFVNILLYVYAGAVSCNTNIKPDRCLSARQHSSNCYKVVFQLQNFPVYCMTLLFNPGETGLASCKLQTLGYLEGEKLQIWTIWGNDWWQLSVSLQSVIDKSSDQWRERILRIFILFNVYTVSVFPWLLPDAAVLFWDVSLRTSIGTVACVHEILYEHVKLE